MARSFPCLLCVAGPLLATLPIVGSTACSTTSAGSDAATDAPAPDDAGTINEPFTGVIGCDGGGPAVSTDCALTLPVTGAISGTFTGFSTCTTLPGLVEAGLPEVVGWSNNSGSPQLFMSVSFNPLSPPPPDQLGTFPLFQVELDQSNDASGFHWSAPTCSITITGSVCSPTIARPHRRVISGTGSCSQPAAPDPGIGGTDASVTIGDFSFVGFIDPP